MSEYILTQSVNLRDERTPGEAAVIGINGRDRQGINSLPESPETNSSPAGVLHPKLRTAYKCGSKAVISHCENNHHVGKVLLCGKDWCPDCGQIGSKAHNQRISHYLPKMQQLDSVGYLVIEFPDYLRHTKGVVMPDGTVVCSGFLFSKTGIKYIEDTVKDVVAGKRGAGNKRHGGYFKRGVARWHWFGSRCVNAVYKKNKQPRCKLTNAICPKAKTDCENYKNDGKLNQHINILAEGEYLEAEKLAQLKADLRQALHIPNLIVNYEYVKYDYENQDAGQIYHKIAYVTRPTFLKKEWDEDFASVLYNLHSGFWWGSWKSERIWQINPNMEAEGLEAAAEIGSGHCHICHTPLAKWSRPIPSSLFEAWGATEIGNTGYYSIPVREWDGDTLTPDMVDRLQSLVSVGDMRKQSNTDSFRAYSLEVSKLVRKYSNGDYSPMEYDARAAHLKFVYEMELVQNAEWVFDTGG